MEWWILPAHEDLQKTLVCVLPFPHHYACCLHNYDSFIEIIRAIERIFSEEMGLTLAEALKLDAYHCASKNKPGISSYDPQDLTDLFSIVDLIEDEQPIATLFLMKTAGFSSVRGANLTWPGVMRLESALTVRSTLLS